MSFALGQSQTPWDVSISQVDLPPNLHFNRWGPVSGLGDMGGTLSGGTLGQMPGPGFDFMNPILNTVDPLNLFHGQKPPPGAVAPADPMKNALPLILGGVVVVGVLWYALK